MKSIGRNDKCWCGSGNKYKKCHLHRDNTKPTKMLESEHKSYLKKWKANSKAFDTQNCYSWMATKILETSPTLVFDIGCGDGTGIKNLLSNGDNPGLKIVSIDENISCLQEAKNNLELSGYAVELIERCEVTYSKDGHHLYDFSPIEGQPKKQVTLIQSDFLSDPYLNDYLNTIGKFDAITIWLLGTHLERGNCNNITSLNITTDGGYRLHVQNKAYELADGLLKTDGILQIVDRTEPPDSTRLKKDIINSHKDQASVTSLDVYELDFILYKEPASTTRIAMRPTYGTSGRKPTITQTAMTSIMSKKEKLTNS